MNLEKVPFSELIREISKRKGAQILDGGIYSSWELRGKYQHRNIKLPNHYQLILISDIPQLDNN